jgi:hypothetical protein
MLIPWGTFPKKPMFDKGECIVQDAQYYVRLKARSPNAICSLPCGFTGIYFITLVNARKPQGKKTQIAFGVNAPCVIFTLWKVKITVVN